nr:helix-turn-helix domain-containing protein [Calderihabitans maritimus]
MADDFKSRAPWNSEPSLKEMANEVGINFDQFIDALAEQKSDAEMAEEFGVSEKTIYHLRDHFERFGIHSIVGQD